MGQGQGFQHGGLGQFIGARFDHHDGIGRTGYHQMEIADLQCLQVGIHDKLALHPADLHTGHRPRERDIRNRQGSGGRCNADHIGRSRFVGGQNRGNNLGFEVVAFREERSQGTIDQAAGQDFLFSRTPLALEISSRNLSCSVGFFNVIDREGQKIDTGLGVL